MSFEEHGSPEFHILANGGREAAVTTDAPRTLEAEVDRRVPREALDRARAERPLIWETWHAFGRR